MSFPAMWVDPEMTIRSEGRQTERESYHTIPLICGI